MASSFPHSTERIAHLLVEEIIPTFGVPEAILSDQGTHS